MKKTVESKREQEAKVLTLMINLYQKKHPEQVEMTEQLLTYSLKRINACPFMNSKTFCSVCTVHCYREPYRQQIKTVMKFSGPRMLFIHPLLTIQHLIETQKQKKKTRIPQ